MGAGGALDRGDRGGLPRRPGDAGQLRRLAQGHRAAARSNIARSGIVGSLVANDFKSSMLVVPLLDSDPTHRQAHRLPRAVAARSRRSAPKYEGGDGQRVQACHVIGFAKLVGDLIDGLMQVALYFGLAALIAAAHHLAATRAACAAPRW